MFTYEMWTDFGNTLYVVCFEVLLFNFLANTLALQEKETIIVVPPKRGKEEIFDHKHFEALYDSVTAFSLMTYDFSSPHRPGKLLQR